MRDCCHLVRTSTALPRGSFAQTLISKSSLVKQGWRPFKSPDGRFSPYQDRHISSRAEIAHIALGPGRARLLALTAVCRVFRCG